MERIEIPRYSDVDVDIILKDKTTGLPIDLSTGIDNVVVFINHLNGTELSKFSKVAASGYFVLNVTNWATGVVSFRITSDKTKLAYKGKYNYEVLVRKADLSLADSKYDTIATGIYLFSLVDSYTSKQALLP